MFYYRVGDRQAMNISPPTERQLKRSSLMGWVYIGDGLFTKDDYNGTWLGYYDGSMFKKEEC